MSVSASSNLVPPPRLAQVLGERPSPVVGWLANRALDAVCALPASWRDALARGVGSLAFALGIRRRVTLDNLAHAFPEKSESERRAIARGAYVTMTRVVLESIDPEDHLRTGWALPETPGPAWEALRACVARGQGALLVTAHFGNWERAGKLLIDDESLAAALHAAPARTKEGGNSRRIGFI